MDTPVVVLMTTLDLCCPCRLFLTLKCVVQFFQLLFHAVFELWYCTSVWLAVSHGVIVVFDL